MINALAYRDGEVGPKFSLRRMASICPKYPQQKEIVGLGKDVGRSSTGREEVRLSQVKT